MFNLQSEIFNLPIRHSSDLQTSILPVLGYNRQFVSIYDSSGEFMREAIASQLAPAAIGPYSQAIRANGFIFCSGQTPMDPASGQVVEGGIRPQTERVLRNLAAVLEAAGSSLDRVVKTSVFLKDMNDFAAMNEVYGQFFKGAPPARSTVQAARLPKDALVEIDVIALA
jgi:2-iminobutanoate/2-iminopropanoate deaminase